MNKLLPVKFFVSFAVLLQSVCIHAQILVTPNITANALIDRLAGSGIVYSNAVLTCPSNASGKFDNGLLSTVLIDSGIVLTTGRVLSNAGAYGVNGTGSNFASVNNVINGGDANLATAAGTAVNNIHDLCKLEFDFVPTGDTIQFRYRFGSEEYPTYNCSNFNDIFAFFISGPGYPTPTNVALIPGTTIPVSINSINDGTISPPNGGILSNCTSLGAGSPFTSFFVNNASSTTITYNGLTTLLTAKAAVTPCSTYHMKFAIADLSDHIYDSGVFLEAGSFSSDVATVVSVTSSNSLSTGTAYAMEGCNAAIITIARPQAKPYAQIVNYTLAGTATNGLDVTTLSGSITIPAFGTSAIINVTALQDGLTEGMETLLFNINGSLCSSAITETLTMQILEFPTFIKPLNDTICYGVSLPLSIIPTPANPDLTFSWSPLSNLNTGSGSNVIATPSITTTYTITSSYPGCPSVDSIFTISVDPLPTLALTSNAVTCNGMNNGSITATGIASSPLTMTLNPGAATSAVSPFIFNNLGANTYTVTLVSGAGCDTTAIATIAVPTVLSWTNVQFLNPLCSGGFNGSIQVGATGGSGILNYTLAPTGSTNVSGNFGGLNAQSYTVTATDANGCTVSTIINLTVSNPVLWNVVNHNNVTPCFGNANGSITVNASGGSGVLTYTLLPLGNSNTTGLYTGLNPFTYTVQVSDVNGCTNSTSLIITQPTALQITSFSTTNILCNGNNTGAINMLVNGGTGLIQYTLLPLGTINTTGIFSNLSASTYTVISTDANNCSISTTVNLTQPSPLQFTSFVVNNVACNGGNTGSINAVCSGGSGLINYTLLPGGTTNSSGTFLNLNAGNYTVQVVDANGCTKSSSTPILQQALLAFTNVVVVPVDCYGNSSGSITITASGGSGTITYQLNPGSINNTSGVFTNLSAQTYSIQVSDALGCSNSTVINISQPTSLQFNTVMITHPSCSNLSNGIISMSGSGGTPAYLYALNTSAYSGVSLFTNLAAGIYTLHLKDVHGCLKDSIISLIPLSALLFTNISLQNVLCKYDNTGFINLNTVGGVSPYSYQLNGTSTGSNSNFQNLTAGNYSIYVVDSIGCIKDTSLTISEPLTALNFNMVNIQSVLCFGNQTGEISAGAMGGSPPYQFAINTQPFQASGYFLALSAGLYTITLKDFYGCMHDTVLMVKQPLSPLTITLKKLKEISCIGLQDGEIYTLVQGGVKPYSFTLNGNPTGPDSSFLNLSPGTYLIEVSDSNGCKAILAVTVAVPTNKPSILLEGLIQNICKGEMNGSIDWTGINGIPPFKYTVNSNFIDTLSKLSNLSSGTYFIQLEDLFGCKADTTLTIANSTTLEANVFTTPASCNGKGDNGKARVEITGGVAPYTYTWVGYPNKTDSLENIPYGTHMMMVKDGENCIDTSQFIIEYNPCCDLYMPNAFSPNGDGHNDDYRMITYGFINVKSFEIFDRWGKRIFYTNHLGGEWDGKFQSIESEIGTYYYLVQYYCQLSKDLVLKKGDFILLR